MPQVPRVTGSQVAPQAAPNYTEHSLATPELLSGPGREMQQAGAAVADAGSAFAQMRKQALDQANALRVDDALNKATELAVRLQHDPNNGFTTQTGYAALKRPSGLPLADEYTGKLKDEIGKIAGSLDNDQQKRLFAMKANNVVTNFYGQALTWETGQQKDYNLSVRDATVSNAKNALTLNFTDPENVQQQTTRIRAAIEGGVDASGTFIPGSAQLQGKSASWAKEQSAAAISEAHAGAVKSALESGNVNLAMAYFQKYSGQMTAKDVLAVQGTLTKDYDTRQGMTIGNQVFDAAAPRIAPSDFGRLTQLVMGAESGGRRFGADGKILTSSKGAQGEMQVMPATAKDPGYGVAPAKDDSPAELARVGRDYLGAMVREFKGDVPKALAAYNAGPQAVADAVKEADKDAQTGAFRGGPPSPDAWLTKLPAETQKYVRGITSQFSAGAGLPPKPTLAELHDQVERTLGPSASSLAIKTAKEQITQRFTDAEKADTQRKAEVTATAMQQLIQNGGRFGELPTSTRAALTQVAPEKVDEVLNFGARIAKGDDSTNPAVYLKLSDPAYLRTLSEPQLFALRTQLSEADYKHFAAERGKLFSGQASNTPGDLNSAAVKSTLDARLRELRIDPTPKDDGGADSARVGAIRRFVDEQVLQMQMAQGKKFNDAETTAAIDRLFANNVQLKGWVTTYSAPAMATKPGDIPGGTRDAIKAAFKAQGVDDPTDAQLLNAFLHLSAAKGRK